MNLPLLFRLCAFAAIGTAFAGCGAKSKIDRHLRSADAHFNAGSYEEAKIEYTNVVQLDPSHGRANERLGTIWFEQGSPLRALPYIVKARSAAPSSRDLRLKSLQISFALGKLSEARKEALAILQEVPGQPEALLILTAIARNPEHFKAAQAEVLKVKNQASATYYMASANLMINRWDWNSAGLALQKARSLDPKLPAVQTALAKFRLRQGETVQAGAAFKAAAEFSPIRSVTRMEYAMFLAGSASAAEAIAYLKDVTTQAPDFLSGWLALATIGIKERRFTEAEEYLKQVFKRDPLNYDAHIAQGQLWLAKGEIGKSLSEFERIAKAYPGLAADKFHLAQVHLQNRDLQHAIGALKEAVTQNPEFDEAILLLSQLNLRAGDAKAVSEAMIDVLSRQPHLVPAQVLLLEALRALGKIDEFEQLIRAKVTSSPEDPQPLYILGLVQQLQEKPEEARQSLMKALELAPDHWLIVTELVKLDLKLSDTAGALRRVQAQTQKNPKSPHFFVVEAQVHAALRQWDRAEASLTKAIDLDPRHPTAYDSLANVLLQRKDSPETIGRIERFVAGRADNLRALMLAGHLFLVLDQFERARDAYEKYLARMPDGSAVINNLAVLYAERFNQPDRALDLARRARALSPDSPVAADTLGWILFKKQNYPEAYELLKESVAKMPENPEMQYHFGMVCQKLGQKDAARAAFQKAAEGKKEFLGKDEIPKRLAELADASVP